MDSKAGSRFIKEGRTKLETVIPLDTPMILFVDPSSACNYACPFCACGRANKRNWSPQKKVGLLSYETFRKVIDDAHAFPNNIKVLRLYKEGEPLLNKRLPDMIRYAKSKNVSDSIDLTTNGSLLTPDLSLAITDSGLDRMNISIAGIDDNDCERNSGGYKQRFSDLVKNIEYLYNHRQNTHIFVKISDVGLGSHRQEEFFGIFHDICDEYAVEVVTSVWPEHNTSAIEKVRGANIYGVEIREAHVCPYIFYQICVNSDGTASACLMDWNHKIIVGNVNYESIVKIWNCENINSMRMEHLRFNKEMYPPCAECGQLKYATLDNIDDFTYELLKRLP